MTVIKMAHDILTTIIFQKIQMTPLSLTAVFRSTLTLKVKNAGRAKMQ
uniref:Uncharacterized protein n=1 Tax=Anguilla anguilla TaxID=7936 RepID=A0A0E9SGX2_ANGAN